MNRKIIFIGLIILCLAPAVSWSADSKQPVADQEEKTAPVNKPVSPLADQIPWYSVNGGGSISMNSTNYRIAGGTIGQAGIGYGTSTNYQARLGFWHGAGGAACIAKPGDVNASGGIPNLQDVIYLVNFVFDKSRLNPPCNGTDPINCWPFDPQCRGDVNGSGGIPNLQDVIFLVNFVFDKDRLNPPCNGIDPGNCWTPVSSGVCCLPL